MSNAVPGPRIPRRPTRSVLLGMTVTLLVVSAAQAQTVDDVVRRYLDARGGT